MGRKKEDYQPNLSPAVESRSDFPPNFVFGVATSAYQVEGACNEGGRGPSIWDAFSHTPGKILDGSNGDVAVDQYHRYKEDVELIAKLGFDSYRFSIAWSRILSDGTGSSVNCEGIAYYNNLINALIERGIQPYATLYHWDLPLHLHESMEGWLNKQIVEHFATYAETCFANFGDRVKNWITLNEPLQTAVNGYDLGIFAPGRCEYSSTEPYLVAHHQILAHAAAVSVYRKKYKDKQGGQIGLVVDCEWAEANSDTIEDKIAAARRLDFHFGWYLDPIYFGDYPEVMRERLGDRLPRFTDKEIEMVRGSVDFVGLNHYTTRFIAHVQDSPDECNFYKDQGMARIDQWEGGEGIGEKAASEWLYVVPWGIRRVLNYMKEKYNNPPIYITENVMMPIPPAMHPKKQDYYDFFSLIIARLKSCMDDEENETCPIEEMLDDKLRVFYFRSYLAEVSQAFKDGVNVKGYFAWSLLDNFEWAQGYTKRFGLVYVDYKNGLSRHPKSSAYWFLRFLRGDREEHSKKD